jgi:hypothetical protein
VVVTSAASAATPEETLGWTPSGGAVLCQIGGGGAVAPRAQNRELVAADSRAHVALAAGGLHLLRDRRDHPVARHVAAAVVDQLQVVQVERDQCQRLARARRGGHRCLELLVERPVVGDAGQGVGRRLGDRARQVLVHLPHVGGQLLELGRGLRRQLDGVVPAIQLTHLRGQPAERPRDQAPHRQHQAEADEQRPSDQAQRHADRGAAQPTGRPVDVEARDQRSAVLRDDRHLKRARGRPRSQLVRPRAAVSEPAELLHRVAGPRHLPGLGAQPAQFRRQVAARGRGMTLRVEEHDAVETLVGVGDYAHHLGAGAGGGVGQLRRQRQALVLGDAAERARHRRELLVAEREQGGGRKGRGDQCYACADGGGAHRDLVSREAPPSGSPTGCSTAWLRS